MISRVPEGLEGSTGLIGRKWLESIRDELNVDYASGLSGAGITQGSATLVTKKINRISTITAGVDDALRVPLNTVAPNEINFFNASGATAKIFPSTDEVINKLAANASYSLPDDTGVTFRKTGTGRWFVF